MSRATVIGTLLALLVLLAARAAPAQALEVQTQDVVIVPAGTTTGDDLLAAGQTVTIAGRVTGETYAFGRSVTVTGTIERDLITAAQQVTIDGAVHGDLRVAAQQVVINGRVEGNVTSFAQPVTLAQQGTVGGSVLGAAQDVTLLGSVGRGVAVGAGSLSHLPWVGGLATFVGLCFGLGALVRQVVAQWPRPAASAPAL